MPVVAAQQARPAIRRAGRTWLAEPWFAPFALINASAVGLVPILLPEVSVRYGVGHVGLVMGAFNLGAVGAPLAGALADRLRAYRWLTAACAALSAVSLWLFPLVGPALQLLLALANGAGFAGAVTVASLLIVERHPKPEWNARLGWLETTLSVGQGCGLLLASWLSTLSARHALLLGAIVPAAAIPLTVALIRRTSAPAADPAPAARPAPAASQALQPLGAWPAPAAPSAPDEALDVVEHAFHRLAQFGQVGEWGPASPSRVHHLHEHHRPLAGAKELLRGGFGWFLAAWAFAYGGTAVVFSLYAVLFSHSFGVDPQTSALAFAVIVFVSLPLFIVAGRTGQRRGPVRAMAEAMAARIVLLALLAAFAATGHIPFVLPLAAFAGIMFAWSFLSVASPALTAQLVPTAQGDAQGLLNASSGVSGLLGSVAGGEIAGAWGYPAALSVGAAAVAIGLTLFLATVARRHPATRRATR
jgi:MFS transporter, DHA1 family, tetracycline resistance protein